MYKITLLLDVSISQNCDLETKILCLRFMLGSVYQKLHWQCVSEMCPKAVTECVSEWRMTVSRLSQTHVFS